MDNRALIRAEGYLNEALDALEIQRKKLQDANPPTPEEHLDNLQRIADGLTDTQVQLLRLINTEI